MTKTQTEIKNESYIEICIKIEYKSKNIKRQKHIIKKMNKN